MSFEDHLEAFAKDDAGYFKSVAIICDLCTQPVFARLSELFAAKQTAIEPIPAFQPKSADEKRFLWNSDGAPTTILAENISTRIETGRMSKTRRLR
jgi:hypothetical protein